MTSPSPLERLAGPGNVLANESPDAKELAGIAFVALDDDLDISQTGFVLRNDLFDKLSEAGSFVLIC